MMNKRGLKLIYTSVLVIVFVAIVSAVVIQTNTKSNFDEGTYNQTFYNTSVGAVQVNLSFNNGTYTSKIFNTGSNVSFNNLSWSYQRIQCPGNMSYINKLNGFCIDQYEASMPSANSTTIGNSSDVARINAPGTMMAVSQAGVVPWVSVSANSARTACSNAGKHLCTDEEWLAGANLKGNVYNLPADPATTYGCVTSGTPCSGQSYSGGSACDTGANVDCVSSEGVYDMVGNVWEWTNNTVDVVNPGGGANWYYFNGTGWATSTGTATAKYGNDGTYFPANVSGDAVLRGGGWDDGAYDGVFCASLYSGPTSAFYNVGFRCCSS